LGPYIAQRPDPCVMTSNTMPPAVEHVPIATPTGVLGQPVKTPKTQWWTPKRKALVFLMFASAAIAELMSGSSPPLEFFNPFSGFLLFVFYGCGVVLVRETALRWNKGYATILLLGAAFGILEEGLSVKSWLDPGWMDLGTLGWYGRFWGINWVWAVWLTLYHAVCSITIPIIITDMIFPQFKGVRLTDDIGWKSYQGFFLAGSAIYLFVFLFLTPYRPPVPQFWFVSSLMVLAIFLAYMVPSPLFKANLGIPTWSPAKFFALGSFFMFFSFIGFGSGIGSIPFLPVLVVCAVDLFVLVLLITHFGTERNNRHLVAFMAGCESPFIFVGFIFEFFNVGFLGMSLVSLGAIIWFVWLYKRAEKVDRIGLPTNNSSSVPARIKATLAAIKL
jgi:hypothetical protein